MSVEKPERVLKISDIETAVIMNLLQQYQLSFQLVNDTIEIPGSYWGEAEAGLIANTVYVRTDTPLHSLLHETCHYICMDSTRRQNLDTNAAGDYDEENAVCYLQILLANEIKELGSQRMMQDMDRWGYTFRLGSAQDWFEKDAKDARLWLLKYGLIDKNKKPTFKLR